MSDATLRGTRKRPPAAGPESSSARNWRRIAAVASAVTLVFLIAVFAYWHFLSGRDPTFPQRVTIECRAFYATAVTSGDTARVDVLHPAIADHEDPNLPSCGTLRRLGLLEVDPSKPPQN